METTSVLVTKFPEAELERLKVLAVRNGVGRSHTDVVRWAALQFLKTVEGNADLKPDADAT